MFEGFSENKISNTNGLSSNDKCKSSTSEEEGTDLALEVLELEMDVSESV